MPNSKSREEITSRAAEANLGARLHGGADVAALVGRLGRSKPLAHQTTFPGGTLPIELHVLSAAEREECRAAAVDVLKARKIDVASLTPATVTAIAEETIHHILARAIRDPATGEQLFASAEVLARVCTEDEIEALFHRYHDHRKSVDPELEELSAEELEEVTEAIKKKDASRLRDIASSMPRRSLLTLVDQLASSLADSSTSTSSSTPKPSSETDRVIDLGKVEDRGQE